MSTKRDEALDRIEDTARSAILTSMDVVEDVVRTIFRDDKPSLEERSVRAQEEIARNTRK